MTLQELSQLTYLKKEIEINQKQLEEIEQTIEKRMGYLSNVLNFSVLKVNDEIMQEMMICKLLIEQRYKKSIYAYKKLNQFISRIEDSMLRQVVMLRFIQGLSWVQVALHLGGGNSADGVRMMVKRYLKKYGNL